MSSKADTQNEEPHIARSDGPLCHSMLDLALLPRTQGTTLPVGRLRDLTGQGHLRKKVHVPPLWIETCEESRLEVQRAVPACPCALLDAFAVNVLGEFKVPLCPSRRFP